MRGKKRDNSRVDVPVGELAGRPRVAAGREQRLHVPPTVDAVAGAQGGVGRRSAGDDPRVRSAGWRPDDAAVPGVPGGQHVEAEPARDLLAARQEGAGEPAMNRDDDEQLLTAGDVAREFRVDPKTVGRWAAARRIKSYKTPGGHRRYRRGDVRALLEADETA